SALTTPRSPLPMTARQFLLKGEVFTEDLIEAWIGYKRSREIDQMRVRPHPYEFFLYYDV
ncbi:hypothetical protein, partial [Nitrospira sp. BLG_2]|uniref:hypothetical protein n=1 Tax=Nitrospira sp. BLG_2 TaxID=3397507 RepID=UPI003B9AA845